MQNRNFISFVRQFYLMRRYGPYLDYKLYTRTREFAAQSGGSQLAACSTNPSFWIASSSIYSSRFSTTSTRSEMVFLYPIARSHCHPRFHNDAILLNSLKSFRIDEIVIRCFTNDNQFSFGSFQPRTLGRGLCLRRTHHRVRCSSGLI